MIPRAAARAESIHTSATRSTSVSEVIPRWHFEMPSWGSVCMPCSRAIASMLVVVALATSASRIALGDRHQLEEADAPDVALAQAVLAARAGIPGAARRREAVRSEFLISTSVGFTSLVQFGQRRRTNHCEHAHRGRCEQERLDAQIDEPREDAGRRVRVYRGEESRWPVSPAWMAICAVSRSRIAHHDHVGVLAQDRPQAAGEREVVGLVYARLREEIEVELDWILDRDDLHQLAAVFLRP
ncbi:MAG: hypothetical protein U0610_08795 [bacterium]